jgi:RNA polymerase sigma factor (sigma-70 family)
MLGNKMIDGIKRVETGLFEAQVRAMQELEAQAIELLRQVPELAPIFRRKRSGRSKTRAYLVERMQEAIERADELKLTHANIAPARAAAAEADGLRWKVAMYGRSVARREARRLARHGSQLEDLMQEATLGLLDAAKRFDLDQKVKFSTYARWWVRARLTKAIDHDPTVRIGGSAIEELRNIRKCMARFDKAGQEWTEQIIAEELGLTLERVRWLLAVQKCVSLDEQIDNGEGEGARRIDILASDDDTPSQKAAFSEEMERLMEAAERCLTERQRIILTRRFGLGGVEPTTLVETARLLNLSRERVRQLEKEALVALRRDGRIRHEVAA